MNPTPAHQMPTVTEKTTFGARFTLGQWWVIISTLVGGIVLLVGFILWLTAMHDDVQTMKTQQSKQAETLDAIRDTVRDIEFRQKYGITAGLPAASKATP